MVTRDIAARRGEAMTIKGVILDLGGVVYVGGSLLPGAEAAISRLRAAGVPLRFLTNTTRRPRRLLLRQLRDLGLDCADDEVMMPAIAARAYLESRALSPHLLVHPALEEDFEGLPRGGDPAVVLGDAGEAFDYATLNAAFRLLHQGAPFLALAANMVFRDGDGELSLDAGPFVRALEAASGRTATVLGKPSRAFFEAAVESLGCTTRDTVMIGDDAENDVAGAIRAGLSAILVRTGKYESGAEQVLDNLPAEVVDDLPAAVDWILERA